MSEKTDFNSVQSTGKKTAFSTGSMRDDKTGKGRFDLIPAYAMYRLARMYENGANEYGDRNWEKGQPLNNYVDSAMRHLFALLAGANDEDHASAVAWNMLAYIETNKRIEMGILPKELDNTVKENLWFAEHLKKYKKKDLKASDVVDDVKNAPDKSSKSEKLSLFSKVDPLDIERISRDSKIISIINKCRNTLYPDGDSILKEPHISNLSYFNRNYLEMDFEKQPPHFGIGYINEPVKLEYYFSQVNFMLQYHYFGPYQYWNTILYRINGMKPLNIIDSKSTLGKDIETFNNYNKAENKIFILPYTMSDGRPIVLLNCKRDVNYDPSMLVGVRFRLECSVFEICTPSLFLEESPTA